MKIKYLDCKGKHKLFSFHRHDYKTWESPEGEYFMCDGGFIDYYRYSHPDMGNIKEEDFIKEDTINNLIEDIREQFRWGQNYDKNKKLLPKTIYRKLKDISDSHLTSLIGYWEERQNDINVEIFKQELSYRISNDIQVPDYE